MSIGIGLYLVVAAGLAVPAIGLFVKDLQESN
jgi:hypothetical protein